MKAVLVVGLLGLLILAAVQVYARNSKKDIERYPYKVVKSYENFEIRTYEASLFTSVRLASNEYNEASRKGFSILASYIFGGNESNEKIAMTSPVAMSLEDSMTMMFMVPRNLKKEDLPKPNSSAIQFTEVPEKRVAAIRFSGWANSTKIENHKKKLIELLNREGIAYTDQFYFLGYDPPYEMVDRRNEVIVELKATEE